MQVDVGAASSDWVVIHVVKHQLVDVLFWPRLYVWPRLSHFLRDSPLCPFVRLVAAGEGGCASCSQWDSPLAYQASTPALNTCDKLRRVDECSLCCESDLSCEHQLVPVPWTGPGLRYT